MANAAARDWHYSATCPDSAIASYGTYEDGRFVGVVVFASGATPRIASPFGLQQIQIRELIRVALDRHEVPTSKIVSVALRLFARDYPATKAIVSYADTNQGHVGAIYQAGNWIYLGESHHTYVRLHGKVCHPRSLYDKYGTQSVVWLRANVDPKAERIAMPPKHKYLYCFDRSMRDEWSCQSLPYPKHASLV